VFHGL